MVARLLLGVVEWCHDIPGKDPGDGHIAAACNDEDLDFSARFELTIDADAPLCCLVLYFDAIISSLIADTSDFLPPPPSPLPPTSTVPTYSYYRGTRHL